MPIRSEGGGRSSISNSPPQTRSSMLLLVLAALTALARRPRLSHHPRPRSPPARPARLARRRPRPLPWRLPLPPTSCSPSKACGSPRHRPGYLQPVFPPPQQLPQLVPHSNPQWRLHRHAMHPHQLPTPRFGPLWTLPRSTPPPPPAPLPRQPRAPSSTSPWPPWPP